MHWHAKERTTDGKLRHPANSVQWRNIDRKFHYPFGKEPRNVRFALSTDGMNPFGNMNYRAWVFPCASALCWTTHEGNKRNQESKKSCVGDLKIPLFLSFKRIQCFNVNSLIQFHVILIVALVCEILVILSLWFVSNSLWNDERESAVRVQLLNCMYIVPCTRDVATNACICHTLCNRCQSPSSNSSHLRRLPRKSTCGHH
jgi:hypothetical protein